jgi:hypothetical protein
MRRRFDFHKFPITFVHSPITIAGLFISKENVDFRNKATFFTFSMAQKLLIGFKYLL